MKNNFSDKEMETLYDALELAEYRIRVRDWADGSREECENEEAIAAYNRSLNLIQEALELVKNKR